jgi:hypothetical protein
MLLTLLLQATAQGTPITVYVTIGAAVLAALASLNATRVSAKTSREVAAQAAQTTRDSAKIAADTAREIKNQDYKFDFYKKIIEKRLAAWADAEQNIISVIASTYVDENDEQMRFRFIAGPEKFAVMMETVNRFIVQQAFWIGVEYASTLVQLRNKLASIANQSLVKGRYNENGTPLCDQAILYELGAKAHSELMSDIIKMSIALNKQMIELHDVETFLVNRVKELS